MFYNKYKNICIKVILMGKFDSILKSQTAKKYYSSHVEDLYRKAHISGDVDYDYFENLNVQDLQDYNKKKKYNYDLISLWAILEMRKYLDFQLGNTYNPYFLEDNSLVPIKNLPDYDYMPEKARVQSLLDIKFVKKFILEGITFSNVYIATYEIMDMNNVFRPFVQFFTKNESGKFVEIAYGYDSNNNRNVELFIPSFNYPVFLTSKGFIGLPLSGKYVKLSIYDYITQKDIEKLLKNI